MSYRIRNLESSMFHNAKQILAKFCENKNTSLKDSYKLAAKNKPLDLHNGLISHLYYVTCFFSFELLALVTENFNQTNLNFSDPAINKLLREAKRTLPEEYKNMNAEELIKLIRDSIAHNSAEIQNTYTKNIKDYEITLNKKRTTPAKYNIPIDDLLFLLEAYDKARIMSYAHGALQYPDSVKTVKDLLQKHKKLGSFDKFLTFYNNKGEAIPIDSYQDKAYLRFLLKHSSLINTSKDLNHFLTRYFPVKDNKLNNYEYKTQLSMLCAMLLDFTDNTVTDPLVKNYLSTLNRDKVTSMVNANITCNDSINIFKKINPQGLVLLLDSEFMQSVFMSSVAFSLMSNRTNDELYELYKEAGHEMDIDTIRHIRNSFMHGRYFYNFNDGYEIYDGQKELDHITTLNINVIEDLYKKYAHNEIFEVMKVRAKIEGLTIAKQLDDTFIIKSNKDPDEM